MWFAALVARHVNKIETLAAIPFPLPWSPESYAVGIEARVAAGEAPFGAAYRIAPHGGLKGEPTHRAQVRTQFDPAWARREELRPRSGDTLAAAASRLRTIKGVGSFLAAQIIADLKPFVPLVEATDWWTWTAPGASVRGKVGSRAGMNRLHRRPADHSAGDNDAQWYRELHELQRRLNPVLERELGFRLCAHNWQNVLCEGEKFWRTEAGESQPKQKYVPHAGEG